MKLDFARIKEIKMVDVVARYKIPLRFKGEYAAACCPLPTHKTGDTGKTFSIHLVGNYWRCFSDSCNANNNGKRGGDCINFVALMDGISQLEAAKKLAGWFGITDLASAGTAQIKTAEPIAQRSRGTEHQKTYTEGSKPPDTVKYMQEVDAWFYALIERGDQEEDVEYWGRVLKSVKSKLVESYRSGQKTKAA
jgi:CHC2 zinc finger